MLKAEVKLKSSGKLILGVVIISISGGHGSFTCSPVLAERNNEHPSVEKYSTELTENFTAHRRQVSINFAKYCKILTILHCFLRVIPYSPHPASPSCHTSTSRCVWRRS